MAILFWVLETDAIFVYLHGGSSVWYASKWIQLILLVFALCMFDVFIFDRSVSNEMKVISGYNNVTMDYVICRNKHIQLI